MWASFTNNFDQGVTETRYENHERDIIWLASPKIFPYAKDHYDAN